MQKHIIATREGNRVLEERQLQGVNPGGYGAYALMDPHAIPPHGYDRMGHAGVLVTPHSLLTVDVVYTALRIISNNIIKMGNLRAFKWGFDAPSGHSYKKFEANQPAILTNTFGGGNLGGIAGSMMQCTGMDRTIWSMALFGEAFWYVLARDKMERPQTIEVLHPAFMDVKVEKGQMKYIYGSGSNRRELPLWNVIQIPMKSLPAARRSLSPVDYAGVAGALALAAYEFGSSWFSQGQAPGFILSTDQKLGTEEVERIADKFMIRHAGLENAHRPVVIDSGLKATKVMASPDEAQYLNTLEYSRQVLSNWFGLPSSWVPNALLREQGSMPHARQEEMITFQQNTLSGYTVPLEEVYSALVASPDTYACFDESQLTRPDAQFQSQLLQALRITQTASINDNRVRVMGWAPVEGGDDVIAPYASNVAPGSAPSQTGSQAPQPKGVSGQSAKAQDSASHDNQERQALQWLLKRIARGID